MARVNGKDVELAKNTTVLQYILEQEFNMNYIVVEYNGNILSKSQYGEKIIDKEDVIEIISFVGGG